MLYISELCEDCAVANEIDYEIDDAWTSIHGIHDNEYVIMSDFNSVLLENWHPCQSEPAYEYIC